MSNEILAQRRRSAFEVQPAQPATNVATLPTAVETIVAGLKEAVAGLKADDISVELSASQEGHRTSARFSLRAYRRGQRVLDEQRDV
jgi:hypothetical protein